MTTTLEPATKAEAYNIDFDELYEELEALERRVNMQSRNLQQVKLETGGGAYQSREHLEEVGVETTQEEMTEVNLSEVEAEKKLSGEIVELESAIEWPTSATWDEYNMKVQINHIGKKEKEHTFQCAQEMEKEENSVELLKSFSQGAEQKIIVEWKPTVEEETKYSMDLFDLCEEMEALERRVKVKNHLIQQVKLEIDGEKRKQIILQGGN
jgi:hypothetical protein